MKEQADGLRVWLLPLVMVLWIILLMPWLPFALRSGMAFDAGIVRASIFVFSPGCIPPPCGLLGGSGDQSFEAANPILEYSWNSKRCPVEVALTWNC